MYCGTIAPLVTPLTAEGDVSPGCVARLIGSMYGQVTALMPALSTGEGWALTGDRWRDMIVATRKHCHGLPVLAGIQLPTTKEVIKRADHALELGCDAIVISAPFGDQISQDQIYQHYATIRAQNAIPLFVYHETQISGNRIELSTLVQICQLPDIVGIKDSSGLPELTRSIIDAIADVPVFVGWEHLLLDVPNVAGFIGPLANLEPALCNRMLAAPTAKRQADIIATCQRYGLGADDWYRSLKTELRRRGILTTDRLVPTRKAPDEYESSAHLND